MNLGDALAHEALTTGTRATRSAAPPGTTRLAITLPSGSIQHFERLLTGTPEEWRATDFEDTGAGCSFNEPVTVEWGRGLDALTSTSTREQQGAAPMSLAMRTAVTPIKPAPEGNLRLFGQVVNHAADPITGEELNMVRWDGAWKALPYYDDELAIVD